MRKKIGIRNGGRTSIYKLLIQLMRSYDLWPAVRLGSSPYLLPAAKFLTSAPIKSD